MLTIKSLACWLAAAAVLGLAGSPARGQDELGNRLEKFERQLELLERDSRLTPNLDVAAGQRLLIDFGGSISLSFVALDDIGQNTHILRQTDLVGYVFMDLDGVHQLFLRGRSTYRDFNSGDAFDSHGDDWVEPRLDRGTYRFDLTRAMSAYQGKAMRTRLAVQAGRQLVHWANGLTLSEEVDGAIFDVGHGPVDAQVLVGRTRPSIFDFDSSRPDFNGDTRRYFYGAMVSYQLSAKHKPYVYGLVQDDRNGEDDGAGVRFRYDSWYVGAGSRGSLSDKLLYGVEVVYQDGEGLSDPFLAFPQTEEDIQAWAFDATLDYLLHDANHTRLSVELLLASGDGDRGHTSDTIGGNRPGTDDNAFNAFGLINTGLAYAPNVSNLIMLRLGAATFPLPTLERFRRLQIGANIHVFGKLNENGAVEEPTANNTYLGTEANVFANWRINSDLSVALRYGVFFPGQAILTDHDERHFFFSGVTLAF